MKILVTGSNGLIGSEVVAYFAAEGHKVQAYTTTAVLISLVKRVIHGDDCI